MIILFSSSSWICRSGIQRCYVWLLTARLEAAEWLPLASLLSTPLGRHAASDATLPLGRHATLAAISHGRGRYTARVLTWHERQRSGFDAPPGAFPSGLCIRTTTTVRRDLLAELPLGQVYGLIASHLTSTGPGLARTIQELMQSTVPTHQDSDCPHKWVDEGASSKGIRLQSSTLPRSPMSALPSGSTPLTHRCGVLAGSHVVLRPRGGGDAGTATFARPWERSDEAAAEFASFTWPLTTVVEVKRLLTTTHIRPSVPSPMTLNTLVLVLKLVN